MEVPCRPCGHDKTHRTALLFSSIFKHFPFQAPASLPNRPAASTRDDILEKIGIQQPRSGGLGPTKTLLTTQTFDEVRLLSNYPAEWNKLFVKWLECKNVTIVSVELGKPTGYKAIFELADAELSTVRNRIGPRDICLHLSPGTPAMAAVSNSSHQKARRRRWPSADKR